MMNKGFEVIEARWLFDMTPRMEGVLNSHVIRCEFVDGSILAQSADRHAMPINMR